MDSMHALCSLIMRALSGLPFGAMRIIQASHFFVVGLAYNFLNMRVPLNRQMFMHEFIGQFADITSCLNPSTVHDDEFMGQISGDLNMLLG